ncbi:MAG: DEAD/DEAH box helicase, partial [Roseiarcus sp.]
LCLVHCKGAHGGHVSQDIRNFYIVCGQAQKNITAKHKGLPRLYHDLKRRHDAWVKVGASRFLKGDMKGLAYFKEKARRAKLQFEVVLVQPGASVSTVTDDSLRLLATTELYLMKTTQAAFRVFCSP